MNKEINFEVLRAISCISIVLMHSASFYTEEYYVYNFYRGLPFSFCDFLQIITRTAIPCFVMISGAFLLDKQDLDIVRFYKNSFKKLGKPTLIFSFIYIIGRYVTGTSYDALFYDTIKGQPVGQLWYMYMLFGLYGVYPFIFYYKNNLSQKNFLFFTVFMTILSCIVHYTCQLIWPIQFIEYLGYFLIGYYLRKNSTSLNVQIKKIFLLAFAFLLITFLLNEIQFYYGDYNPRYYRNPNFPTIIIASILFFSAFCKIQISKASNIVLDIADKSMLIYLVHPIFMVIFKRGIKLLYSDPILPNPFWYVPLMFLFSVFCSFFISKKINHLFISK